MINLLLVSDCFDKPGKPQEEEQEITKGRAWFGQTNWLQPVLVVLVLLCFSIHIFLVAWFGKHHSSSMVSRGRFGLGHHCLGASRIERGRATMSVDAFSTGASNAREPFNGEALPRVRQTALELMKIALPT